MKPSIDSVTIDGFRYVVPDGFVANPLWFFSFSASNHIVIQSCAFII